MKLPERTTILVLAPHTDDGELGAGASVARWVEDGHDVHYVAFSACESSVPAGFPRDVLRHEVLDATGCLGIKPDQVRVLEFAVREFGRDRQPILQAMVELNRELAPDLVLAPSAEDLHQDHAVIGLEALRAFKRTSVLAYEVPWNNLRWRASGFVAVAEHHLEAKIAAMAAYRSQGHRPYADADYLRAALRFHGVQAGHAYAEAFDVQRWML